MSDSTTAATAPTTPPSGSSHGPAKRHGSLERYRPAAAKQQQQQQHAAVPASPEAVGSWADEVEANGPSPRAIQAEVHGLRQPQAQAGGQGGRGHGRGRRGGGGGGGGPRDGGGKPSSAAAAVDEADLEQSMKQLSLKKNDLRHRLNQRSRQPEMSPVEPQQEAESNRSEGNQGGGRSKGGRNQHRRVQGRGVGATAQQQRQQQQQQQSRAQQKGGGNQHPHQHQNNGLGRGDDDHYYYNSSNYNLATNGQQQQQQLPRPKRNTENFDPSHAPPEMRILCAQPGLTRYNRDYTPRDVLVVSDLFCSPDDLSIYDKLLYEIEHSGQDLDRLWQLWHGDSHVIADDKRRWKESCPTFNMVLDKLTNYFNMDVKATRLNWYRTSSEWKPFHHDAAAMKPQMARTQNFTCAVSFGAERDAAFEHAKTKTVISMPQPNGTIYTFGRDVNILWRHGIPQVKPENYSDRGRISIIAWGWIDQVDL